MGFMKVTLHLILICTPSWQFFILITIFHAACLLEDYLKRKTFQTKSKPVLNQRRLRKYLTFFHVKYRWIPFSTGYTVGQREIIFLVIKYETGNSIQSTGLLTSMKKRFKSQNRKKPQIYKSLPCA